MKDITRYINESVMEWDKSVKAPEKKKVKDAIYKELEKNNTTGKFYRDTNWEGVRIVKQDIENAFKNVKNPEHEYEVSIAPDNGGYRTSKDGYSKWKQYKVEIYVKGAELPFMGGTLNCHAAGTVEDPFETYDMSCCIGY
jgi:hypothetical protein